MQNRDHAPPSRGAHPPIVLILAVVVLVLIVVGGALGWLAYQFNQLDEATAHILRLAIFWLPIVVGTIGGVALLVELGLIAWRRWGTHEYIKAAHVTRLTAAQNQRFPAQLHSLSFHDSSKPQIVPVEEPLALPAPDAAVPSFAQLLDSGLIGPGRPFILGFDAQTAQPIEGGWTALYSCGVGAMQGAGKSWLAAFLLAQSALQGGRLIVCDPHAGNPESLSTRIEALSPAYMCNVATTPDEILAALKLGRAKLQQRMDGSGANWPVIIAVDEWTSLLRGKLGEEFPTYATDFAEQGRKFGVNALLAAQGWTKDTAGTVRNRLTSHYVLRQRPDEARYQLGLPAGQLPLDVRLLPDATGYLLDVHGNLRKVVIPAMNASDLVRVGAMLAASGSSAAVAGSPFGFQTAPRTPPTALAPPLSGAGLEPVGSRSGAGSSPAQGSGAAIDPAAPFMLPPEAARVAELFASGKDLPAIVLELRGITSKQSGSRYQAALKEVTELLRQAMKGTHL